jgi:hypothetical protein
LRQGNTAAELTAHNPTIAGLNPEPVVLEDKKNGKKQNSRF